MLYAFLHEVRICIGEFGDATNRVNSVNKGNDLAIFRMTVDNSREAQRNKYTLCIVRSQFSSIRDSNRTVNKGTCHALTGGGGGYKGNSLILMVSESSKRPQRSLNSTLDDQRWPLTDRYHALAVIIQILQDDLAEGIDLPLRIPAISSAKVLTQKLPLLFQIPKESGQPANDGDITAHILVLFQDDGKVEDELITVVLPRVDTHRISKDSIVAVAHRYQTVTEFLSGYHKGGDAVEIYQRC